MLDVVREAVGRLLGVREARNHLLHGYEARIGANGWPHENYRSGDEEDKPRGASEYYTTHTRSIRAEGPASSLTGFCKPIHTLAMSR